MFLYGRLVQNRISAQRFRQKRKNEFENLKDWFGCLYEILLGQQQGPRMGSFILLYGLEETIDLLDRVLAGEDLSQIGSSRTLK